MTRILLVFTGGTIGSLNENGNIDLDPNAAFKLISLFQQRYPAADAIQFKTLRPLQILSENLHPKDWETLIAAIETENHAEFDGIIITHGTDTLAFSAAALGLYFNRLSKPILLVSSNLPLENPQANGIPNLIAAVDFIRQQALPGVFVAYQNPGSPLHIHQGTRLLSCLPLSGDFISIQSQPLQEYQQGQFVAFYQPAASTPQALRANFGRRILLIRPYPGLDYRQFKLDDVDAVLHDLYHSGTACTRDDYGQQHALSAFIRDCRQRQLPVYLAPALYSDSAYNSTRQLLEQGACMIWNQTLEVAYAKLLLAYGNHYEPAAITALLSHNLAGEMVR